jgi:hypothetical protein
MNRTKLPVGLALASALCLGLTGPRAAAQDTDVNAALETCIRMNAARVEQAFESLSEAVGFLTNNICAKPAADAASASQTERTARQRERLETACAELESQTDQLARFGNPLAQQCDSLPYVDIYQEEGDLFEYGYYGGVTPEMTSLASSLMLDARLARTGAN